MANYKDSEQSYRGWIIDVYQSLIDGKWVADFWRDAPDVAPDNTVRGDRRKEVVQAAKAKIDAFIKRPSA